MYKALTAITIVAIKRAGVATELRGQGGVGAPQVMVPLLAPPLAPCCAPCLASPSTPTLLSPFPSRFSPPFARGFTLVEMLVVLLLGALLTATVLPAMQRVLEGSQYRTSRDAIVGRLGELSYEAFASGHSIVLTSSAGTDAAAPPASITAPPAAPVSGVALAPGGAAGAPLAPAQPAPPPRYPVDLPEGWAIEVKHPIRFAFNGICEGGELTLFPPGRPPERLTLAAPMCQPVGPAS